MISDPMVALKYLTYGFLAFWILLAGYVGFLALRLGRAEKKMERLERRADSIASD